MSEYYAVQRSDEYLEHYGIKGMKWGVRKAIESGNSRALGRQYKKAAKKLAKLEKRASSGKKYAKRAAMYGAGAAAAGGLALAGTGGVASGLSRLGGAAAKGSTALGAALSKSKHGKVRKVGAALLKGGAHAGAGLGAASNAVAGWGAKNSVGTSLYKSGIKAWNSKALSTKGGAQVKRAMNNALVNTGHKGVGGQLDKLHKINNNTYARLGAAALGAGLGAAAARNAYKAATTKRAAKKAAQFRSEMNKAFAGTQYANGAPRQGKRRKRRS